MILYIVAGIFIAIILLSAILKVLFENGRNGNKVKPKYLYARKKFLLSRSEHECYDALIEAVGSEYYIFAQVHLPTLLDHTMRGQNWRAALAHINRKSVDFVLCDKDYISPKLTIELDDKSHKRSDRQERDKEVERILDNAGLPLLRLENHGAFKVEELQQKIRSIL